MTDRQIFFTSVVIFFARICDVSLDTVQTIVRVQGRTTIAFVLAICEITICVAVTRTVINQIADKPLLVIFYAFGYATGDVVGILVECKFAFGTTILRIITRTQVLLSPRIEEKTVSRQLYSTAKASMARSTSFTSPAGAAFLVGSCLTFGASTRTSFASSSRLGI